jgi:predicted metalloprotease
MPGWCYTSVMNSYDIKVEANWDAEAGVWVATSEGIGLVTEADSLEALRKKLPGMIEDLIADSHADCVVDIEIVAHAHEQTIVRRPAA